MPEFKQTLRDLLEEVAKLVNENGDALAKSLHLDAADFGMQADVFALSLIRQSVRQGKLFDALIVLTLLIASTRHAASQQPQAPANAEAVGGASSEPVGHRNGTQPD